MFGVGTNWRKLQHNSRCSEGMPSILKTRATRGKPARNAFNYTIHVLFCEEAHVPHREALASQPHSFLAAQQEALIRAWRSTGSHPLRPAPRRCMSAPSAEPQTKHDTAARGARDRPAAVLPELHVDSQLASQAVAAALPFTEV